MTQEERTKNITRPVEDGDMSPGMKALMRALNVLFAVLKGLMVLTLLYFVFSGVFVVKQHQAALVLRFGRIVGAPDRRLLGPGIHWAFPYPIDEVVKIDAERVYTMLLSDFWYKKTALEELRKEIEQEEGGTEELEPGRQGYSVTGDVNIVHTLWLVRYRLKDPLAYFLKDAGRSTGVNRNLDISDTPFIRSAVAAAVTAVSGRMNIDDILKERQEEFREEVKKTAQAILDADRTGIEIERLDMRVRVPLAVRDAFNDVLAAEMDKNAKENEARKYRNKVLHDAQGEAARIIANAKEYYSRVVYAAQADAKYMESLLEKFPKETGKLDVYLRQYYLEVLDEVLSNVKAKYVLPSPFSGTNRTWLILGKDPRDLGVSGKGEKR